MEWSPWDEGRLAVATSQNYGFAGHGRQLIYQLTPDGATLEQVGSFDTQEVFLVTYSGLYIFGHGL